MLKNFAMQDFVPWEGARRAQMCPCLSNSFWLSLQRILTKLSESVYTVTKSMCVKFESNQKSFPDVQFLVCQDKVTSAGVTFSRHYVASINSGLVVFPRCSVERMSVWATDGVEPTRMDEK